MTKFFIIGIGLVVSILFGVIALRKNPTKIWWKITASLFVALSCVLTIMPPITGTLSDLIFLSENTNTTELQLKFKIKNILKNDGNNKLLEIIEARQDQKSYLLIDSNIYEKNYSFNPNNNYIAHLKYDKNYKRFETISKIDVCPILTIPYINTLGELIRIINLHVPLAWVAFLAFFISMLYSIRYLIKMDTESDIIASSSAVIGTLFCILATVSGMLWAKKAWGTYWNWDPREVSIFILLLIYFAYFSLRVSLNNEDLKARLSSAYSIIAFVSAIFFIFIMPRLFSGLHPGSLGDNSAGPVISTQKQVLNISMQITFSISLFAWTAVYFWLLNITTRLKRLSLLKFIK